MRKKIIKSLTAWLICCATFIGIPPAVADVTKLEKTEPLWEISLFFGGASLPAYKGSDESNDYALAFPYFVYRGEILSIDNKRISGLFYKSERFEFDTSIFVDVNDNDSARYGMPELDPVIMAIGPAIKAYFRRIASAGYNLYVEIPIRAAVSGNTDGGIDLEYRGIQAKINLFYENKKMFGTSDCELTTALGIAFYDTSLAGYYYDVDEPYVETGRPEFDAEAGYASASVSVDLLYRFTNNFAARSYVRVDSLHGAAFEGSPLVSEPVTFATGLALMFTIWESETRVTPK